MKKRFNLTWRVVTALLLLVALVPALVVGVGVAVAESNAPTLRSINWVDGGAGAPGTANGIIDGGVVGVLDGDYIDFYFSESMLTGVADTLSEINNLLDSSAPGTNDYGSNNANAVWLAGQTVLRVTLGDDCSTQLSGKTVNPKDGIKDKSGNSDATSATVIPGIPAAQDTTAPTLLSINWVDFSGDGLMGVGDYLIFSFSEQMDATTINIGNVETVLDSTATGAVDYAPTAVQWGSVLGGTDCYVQVTLGAACSPALGGKTVNPTAVVTDMKRNPDGTPAGVAIPLPPDDVQPTLIQPGGIGWINNDGGTPAVITPGDQLVFKFSESMDTTIINPASIDTDLPLSGTSGPYTYGTLTPCTLSWDTSKTLLTVTLGDPTPLVDQLPTGSETVNPLSTVLDAAGNADNTIGAGPAVPSIPTPVYKETTRPTLRSINWVDTTGDGDIGPADQIIFCFSESMDWSVIDTLTEINSLLNSTAPGTNDYGTITASASWNSPADTMLTVTLGSDCSTQLAGMFNANAKTVKPDLAVTDKAGNQDNTASVGPAIPLAPDTLQPTLLSISWVDGFVSDFIINAGDTLLFSFSESMDPLAVITPDADLDSSAVGTLDYNGAGIWDVTGTQMAVTLGAPPSIDFVDGKLTCTVNPSSLVTDAKGNTDGTVGSGPAIPLPPDKTNPTLVSIAWIDVDHNDQMNQGDRLIYQFSESMDETTITFALLNANLDTTALGVVDYSDGVTAPLHEVIWNVPSYTELTIILGASEQIDGGEWVNPLDAVLDRIGNIDMTVGGGVQVPSVSGVPTPIPTTAPTATPSPVPECAVTYPTNNASIAMPGPVSINGTSGDDVAVTGLKVRVFNVSSGLYWNGSVWAANLSLAAAPAAAASDGTFNSVSEPWSYTTLPIWGNGSSYQVQAQVTDGTNTANSSVVLFGIGVTPTPPATPTPTPTVAPTTAPTVAPTTAPTVAPTATPGGSSGSGTVPTTGGTVATTDGKIEVTFPADAFDASTTVTIASASCHGDTDAFVVGSTCFSITPSGELGAEATICVQLSTYDLNLGDEGDLTLGYWADGTWNEASDVTVTGNEICGKTSHLSDWAVLSSTGEGWLWWYWALIGGGAFIVVLAIILLLVLPKRGKREEIPAEELYGEEEEEF